MTVYALVPLVFFVACANFPITYQHSTKHVLTTETTKATKDCDIFAHKLRALRVLRGQICFFFFGCDSTALGSMRLTGQERVS
jgi:hypothetical protein